MYAYDQSPKIEREGVVSELVTFAGVCEPESMVEPGFDVERPNAPLHCGSLMALVTPAVGPVSTGYSFEPPAEPVRLPPVWRCGCGFQLDAWDGGTLPEDPLASLSVPAVKP